MMIMDSPRVNVEAQIEGVRHRVVEIVSRHNDEIEAAIDEALEEELGPEKIERLVERTVRDTVKDHVRSMVGKRVRKHFSYKGEGKKLVDDQLEGMLDKTTTPIAKEVPKTDVCFRLASDTTKSGDVLLREDGTWTKIEKGGASVRLGQIVIKGDRLPSFSQR